MIQRIELTFSKSLTKLAGNAFGRQTYEDQVKKNINLNQPITFVFPERIDRIASSFVQGFFDEIVNELGISGIDSRVSFESSIIDLKNFVLENLE